MKEFSTKIYETLQRYGYPQKRVSLPTEKMYEVADNKGLSFNSVLDYLKNEYQVAAEVKDEKIIFSPLSAAENFSNLDVDSLKQQAEELMQSMSADELKQMQESFQNMSEDEKQDLMQKGKEMGLF